MATTYTTNYHLGKQLNHSDNFSMNVLTDNADIIDSTLKTNADNISSVTSTVSGHTTSIGELQSTVSNLSSTVSGYSSTISTLQTDVGRNTTNLNKYAVPQHLETDTIIVDTDLSNFKDGVMVGMFSKKLWDRNATDLASARGTLLAYNLNPLATSTSSYFPEYVQILILNDEGYGRKILMRSNGGSGWGNFTVLSMQEQYCSSIDNTFLNNVARRRGTFTGDIATEITGLSAAERGVVRAYSFSDNIAYDDSHDCIQIVDTASGVHKSRFYDYMNNTWSAWV